MNFTLKFRIALVGLFVEASISFAQVNCDTLYVPRGNMFPAERRELCRADTLWLGGLSVADGFQSRWFKDGTELLGENQTKLMVTQAGTYSYRLFKDGCLSQVYDQQVISFRDQKRPKPRQLSIVQQPSLPGQSFTLNLQDIGNPAQVSRAWFRSGILELNTAVSYTTNNLGEFKVQIDSNLCTSYSNSILVRPAGAIQPNACVFTPVGIDGLRVEWAPTTSPAIQDLKIYRKYQAESCFLFPDLVSPIAGFVLFGDSLFKFTSIEMRMTAIVNGLGGLYESEPSEINKTIFLGVSSSPSGFTPRNILNWSQYAGFQAEKYAIIRNEIKIDSVLGTENLYEDFNPPIGAKYRVEAINSGSCLSFGRMNVVSDIDANVRKSISNTSTVTLGVTPGYMEQPVFNPRITVNAGTSFLPIQAGSGLISLQSTPLGGFWSGQDVSTDGVFLPQGCGTRKLFYTVPGVGKDSSFITVTPSGVSNNPVSIDGPISVCGTTGGPVSFTGLPTGGTWSAPVSASGSFNPSASGGKKIQVTYSKTVLGCNYSVNRELYVFPSNLPIQVSGNPSPCVNQGKFLNVTFPLSPPWGNLSYQWYRNNSPIANATSNRYDASVAGNYKAEVSVVSEFVFPACQVVSPEVLVGIGTNQPPQPPLIQRNGTVINMSNYTGGTNEWYKNGVLISGQTSSSLTLNSSGVYHAARKEGTCLSDLSNAINFDMIAGNEILIEEQFKVFPNPVSDIVQIRSGFIPSRIWLQDLLGQQVEVQSDENGLLNLRNTKAGFYILCVSDDQGKTRKTAIIKR